MPYRDFSSFHNIKLLFGSPKEGLNFGYTCTPNFEPVQNPSFDDDFFFYSEEVNMLLKLN